MTNQITVPELTETETAQRTQILDAEVTPEMVALARKLLESSQGFTTTALFALRVALGEMIGGEEETATETALGSMVGILATVEASEV